MIPRLSLAALTGAAVLAAAGCSDTGVRRFGTASAGGSEIRATAPPPLSVPPSLSDRPSRAGAAPDETPAQASAATPPDQDRAAPVSTGQDAIIDAAGPSAPANIRQRVEQDQQIRHQDQGFTDQLLFGQPGVSAGAQTPLIQSGSKSWLDSIF
jgi:hypothetical protein